MVRRSERSHVPISGHFSYCLQLADRVQAVIGDRKRAALATEMRTRYAATAVSKAAIAE